MPNVKFKRPSGAVIMSSAAMFVALTGVGGAAAATGVLHIGSANINKGAVTWSKLSASAQGRAGELRGAFEAVEQYQGNVGDRGIATVACSHNNAVSKKYIAMSGGASETNGTTDMTVVGDTALPIIASFPGRMDWTTNEPMPGRTDGWIIQIGTQGEQDPNMQVWALCVPVSDFGGKVPIHTTTTSTG
jgi:hypothetical protein